MTDIHGDHQVACGGGGDRIARHNSLCDVIFATAQAAALDPRREVPALFQTPVLVLQMSCFPAGMKADLLHWMYLSSLHSRS